MEKILEKSGNFVSPEKWEPWLGIPPQATDTLVVATARTVGKRVVRVECILVFLDLAISAANVFNVTVRMVLDRIFRPTEVV